MASNRIALFMSVQVFGRVVSRPQKDICIGLWNVSINPYILTVYIIRDNLQILLLLYEQPFCAKKLYPAT